MMIKEAPARTMGILVIGALVILGWGIAFGFIKRDVHYVGKTASDNTTEIKILDDKYNDFGRTITRIDTRQEVMIKSLDEIKRRLK